MSSLSSQNWETVFQEVFTLSLEDFYESLTYYPLDICQVLPSNSISVAQIFN